MHKLSSLPMFAAGASLCSSGELTHRSMVHIDSAARHLGTRIRKHGALRAHTPRSEDYAPVRYFSRATYTSIQRLASKSCRFTFRKRDLDGFVQDGRSAQPNWRWASNRIERSPYEAAGLAATSDRRLDGKSSQQLEYLQQ